MGAEEDSSWGWRVASDDEDNVPSASRQRDDDCVIEPADERSGENEPLLGSRRDNMGELGDSSGSLSSNQPAHLTQYITAVAATLGCFSMGAILGYSSPASPQLQQLDNSSYANITESCGGELSLSLTDDQISWFGSTVNIGAMIGAPTGGILIKTIGRRTTMIGSLLFFLLGWLLIGLAVNMGMLIAGRIVTGFCAGLVSISVPTYIGEIASPDIRGALGTGFQLMVVSGILYSYLVGAGVCWQWLSLACLAPAVIFSVWMFFNPESPTYLVAKQREEDASKTLVYLRGKNYNIQPELDRLKVAAEEDRNNQASFSDLGKPYVLKPLMISLALMFFQQTSGVNAILFNLSNIFKAAQSTMSADASSILIAVVQVVMTGVGAFLMDRAGRKLLLLVSSAAMAFSLILMGTYFYFLQEKDSPNIGNYGWVPLLSLIIFISFFSIGYGPVPWIMMGELFTSDVKEMAGSLATVTNWGMSFIVTLLFTPMSNAMGDSGVYWLFGGLCIVNFIYCFFFVKETKGKTIEEITAMFGGPTATAEKRRPSDISNPVA